MMTKGLLVSFLVFASILLSANLAIASDVGTIDSVKVEGIEVSSDEVSIIAGETIDIKVQFTSDVNASDITVEAELEGDKKDVDVETSPFDVESGKSYRKTLTLKVPYELKDKLSDDVTLNIKISGDGYKTTDTYTLRVQRSSYNSDIKSVTVSQKVDAGETFPVDIVLKNIGYNDLDDLYVTAKISALDIEKSSYFGDLVALECDEDSTAEENYGVDIKRKCNEDDTDTVSGRLYLKVPYNVKPGIYALEVEVKNEDATNNIVKQIVISNDISENVIASASKKTVAVGENTEFNVLIVNPTDKLKVYRIISESSSDISSSVSESVVAVPAGSSKTVTITAKADSEGEYNFNVNVFSGDEFVSTVALALKAEGILKSSKSLSNPIVVLTVVLAIIFIVLLVVLIVLIGKKPEKSEEFGESYY